jgi:hypothetical protein
MDGAARRVMAAKRKSLRHEPDDEGSALDDVPARYAEGSSLVRLSRARKH